jgi:hypothetical protein
MKLLIALLVSFSAFAGELRFSPTLTDRTISRVKGDHQATWPEQNANGLLVISINGTGAEPHGLIPFGETITALGFHKLSLDYHNGVIPTVCRHATNPSCYDFYQAELVFGEQVSYEINIAPQDSVYSRLIAAMEFLVRRDPTRWGHFWKNGEPNWEKIVLYGHSQGAGHAAYLAKRFAVKGVLLTGGPFGLMPRFGFAGWAHTPGATDPRDYRALLHQTDYFGVDEHITMTRLMLENTAAPIQYIQLAIPPRTNAQIFVGERTERDGHNAIIIDPAYRAVWESILRSFISTR